MAREVEGAGAEGTGAVVRLGVVGGRLQGTEAAYLGLAAGYHVILVDRCAATPASGLAAETHVFDVTREPERARAILASCDVVLPACEDVTTLEWLSGNLPAWGVPCAFHLPSYRVTCSKIRSDRLFGELGVPRPLPWPECGFPVVVKPSGASGSQGVSVARDEVELAAARARLQAAGHEVVVQQYVDGASLSLEVLRYPDGTVVPLVPTLLEFDEAFDCRRVVAPVDVSTKLLDTLAEAGRVLAEGVGLIGLMDVEVMLDDNVPRVIEIDARLPSQTPTAVFHATGLNLVTELVGVFTEGLRRGLSQGLSWCLASAPTTDHPGGVCYQHVRAERGTLAVLGEHVMSGAGPLRLVLDEHGADEILTDRVAGASEWSATLICRGADALTARGRAAEATARLARDGGLSLLHDAGPRPVETAGRPRVAGCGTPEAGAVR
ncbi:MAG: 3-methylornithine--L-lysine ligase PylC [Thermoleophilia bacterium]